MKYFLFPAVLLFASHAVAQTPMTGDDGYIFPPIEKKNPAKPTFPSYANFDPQGPYAVFVATTPRKVPGVPVCTSQGLDGVSGACIVVSDGRYWLATLPATATDQQIRVAAGLEAGRMAVPFAPSAGRDDNPLAAGPWPKSLPRPSGLRRYRPARFTQEIAVTNNRDRITPVPRNALAAKWLQPGGLLDVTGWRSELYRYVPEGAEPFIADIPVWNGSNYQNNRGWRRTYPDGSLFADVLSNAETGKVFEVRYREKRDGEWESFVAWFDRSEQPHGYVRVPNRQCQSCHAEAGTGGYASGLVPGSDGVLSDPFPALERPITRE